MTTVQIEEVKLKELTERSNAWIAISAKYRELAKLQERYQEVHQKELSAKNQVKECQDELNAMVRDASTGQLRLPFDDPSNETPQDAATNWKDWPISKLGDAAVPVSKAMQKTLKESGIANLGQLEKVRAGLATGFDGLGDIFKQRKSQEKVENALLEFMPVTDEAGQPIDEVMPGDDDYENVEDEDVEADVDELARTILAAKRSYGTDSEDPGDPEEGGWQQGESEEEEIHLSVVSDEDGDSQPEAEATKEEKAPKTEKKATEKKASELVSIKITKTIERLKEHGIEEGNIMEGRPMASGVIIFIDGDQENPCTLMRGEFELVS